MGTSSEAVEETFKGPGVWLTFNSGVSDGGHTVDPVFGEKFDVY